MIESKTVRTETEHVVTLTREEFINVLRGNQMLNIAPNAENIHLDHGPYYSKRHKGIGGFEIPQDGESFTISWEVVEES